MEDKNYTVSGKKVTPCVTHLQSHSHSDTHSLTDRPEYSMPPALCFNGGIGIKSAKKIAYTLCLKKFPPSNSV